MISLDTYLWIPELPCKMSVYLVDRVKLSPRISHTTCSSQKAITISYEWRCLQRHSDPNSLITPSHNLPKWGPSHHVAEKSQPYWALSDFLIHRIHEYNKIHFEEVCFAAVVIRRYTSLCCNETSFFQVCNKVKWVPLIRQFLL